jgi:hypothetical protein
LVEEASGSRYRRPDIWDSDLTGFGVRIFAPTRRYTVGARSFLVNYRVGGREKRFTIGSYPDWSAHRYKDEHLPKKADSSQVNDWAMIENEILPAIGERTAAAVHAGNIEALRRAITVRGHAVRANRVLAVASKMFSLTLKRKEGALGDRGIRINAVAPGAVETDMPNFTRTESGLGMQTLKQRLALPDDSGGGAFLVSEGSPLDHRRHHPRRRRLETLKGTSWPAPS